MKVVPQIASPQTSLLLEVAKKPHEAVRLLEIPFPEFPEVREADPAQVATLYEAVVNATAAMIEGGAARIKSAGASSRSVERYLEKLIRRLEESCEILRGVVQHPRVVEALAELREAATTHRNAHPDANTRSSRLIDQLVGPREPADGSTGKYDQFRAELVAALCGDRLGSNVLLRESSLLDPAKQVGDHAIYFAAGPDVLSPLVDFPKVRHFHFVDVLAWGKKPELQLELIKERLKSLAPDAQVEIKDGKGHELEVNWTSPSLGAQTRTIHIHPLNYRDPKQVDLLFDAIGADAKLAGAMTRGGPQLPGWLVRRLLDRFDEGQPIVYCSGGSMSKIGKDGDAYAAYDGAHRTQLEALGEIYSAGPWLGDEYPYPASPSSSDERVHERRKTEWEEGSCWLLRARRQHQS